MIKHVILWQLNEEFSAEQKQEIRLGIKQGLEGLKGKIPGLLDIRVQTKRLPSSNADVMLDSTFDSEQSLKQYATHPKHVAVADSLVRPYTQLRLCLDFPVEEN